MKSEAHDIWDTLREYGYLPEEKPTPKIEKLEPISKATLQKLGFSHGVEVK